MTIGMKGVTSLNCARMKVIMNVIMGLLTFQSVIILIGWECTVLAIGWSEGCFLSCRCGFGYLSDYEMRDDHVGHKKCVFTLSLKFLLSDVILFHLILFS